MRYVVITGGVMSGLGKGIVAASIGKILKSYSLNVGMIKMDGYLNVDPGTLNPYEHGEVFVLDDGTETDLDLGHYERFLNLNLDKNSSITSGKVYKEVIDNERKGIYLGKTVQLIPHVTDVIINHITQYGKNKDVVIIEVGGTVGDMENMIFLEALRQISMKEKVVFVHLSYVPISSGNEQKTKPTQHSIANLLQLGIHPHIIIGRCKTELNENAISKISLFGGVEKKCVISDPDAEIYEVPLILDKQNIGKILVDKLGIEITEKAEKNKFNELKKWENLVENLKKTKTGGINIGIVGKYAHLEDAYLSIKEALKHVQMNLGIPVNFMIVDSESENLNDELKNFDGIIVPGGFGIRGAKGKIETIKFCRVNKIPFLGICFGFQLAVIEFARNVCNIEDANSSEIDKRCKNPVIDLLFEQRNISELGGTMRLGSYQTVIKSDTLAQKIYKKDVIERRYRHRYGLNLKYKEILESYGLIFSGTSPDGKLMEILELSQEAHPFFIASQYHPEFSSRPERPEELFMELVKACAKRKGNI